MSDIKLTYNQIAGQRTQRIEALSDGVFAIALTLLVLDLRVPVAATIHSEQELIAAFLKMSPKFLSYFLSFLTLAIFWIGHSSQFQYIVKSDRPLNGLSLFFLLLVSVLPFTTAFLGEYITFPFSVGLYWLNIFLMGVLLFFHWRYAWRHQFISVTGAEGEAVNRGFVRRIVIAQSLYAGGALLCFVSTYLSIAFIILIQLNYALGIIHEIRLPRTRLLRK